MAATRKQLRAVLLAQKRLERIAALAEKASGDLRDSFPEYTLMDEGARAIAARLSDDAAAARREIQDRAASIERKVDR